jgi:excisionase family DNA binding protein
MSTVPSKSDSGGQHASPDMLVLLKQISNKVDDLRGQLSQQRKDFHTVEEFASLTGRSGYTVRRWITEGKLSAIRIAEGGPRGRLIIPHAEIERLIASGKGGRIPDSTVN